MMEALDLSVLCCAASLASKPNFPENGCRLAPAANGASISDAMPRLLEDTVWESVAFQDHTLSA
jgi:hypothetical protein